MTAQPSTPQSQWAQIIARDPGHSQRYIDRFSMLAAQGHDLVGEARLVDAIPGPVNVLSFPDGPALGRLGDLGVARITFGSSLFKAVMSSLADRVEGLRP